MDGQHSARPSVGRILKIAAVALILLLLLAFVVLQFLFRWSINQYYENSTPAFEIPGIYEGFVPQGFDYDGQNGLFIVSGYMNGDGASPVYLVEEDGDIRSRLTLTTHKGEPYTGHSGGIAVHGDYVYVAGGRGGYFYVYHYADFLAAGDEAVIECVGRFSTKVSDDDYVAVSFISDSDTHLWVGEFYDTDGYETLDSHKLYSPSGDWQQALAVGFAFDENAEFGISPTPDIAYSLPDKVQGMCFDGGTVYLSTSRGFNTSHIYAYDAPKSHLISRITVLETDVALYFLDSNTAFEIKAPPMAEEIVVLGGRLYIMSEFASGKYILGRFFGGETCYSTNLSKYR